MNNKSFSSIIPAAYAECSLISNQPALAFHIKQANESFVQLLESQNSKENDPLNKKSEAFTDCLKRRVLEKSVMLRPLDLTIMEVPFQGTQFHIFIVLLKKQVSKDICQRLALAVMNNNDFIDFFQKNKDQDEQSWQSRQLANSLFTSDHALRIKEIAREFGEYAQLSTDEINELMILSIMHDIGKIHISPELLNYSGSFNQKEKEEMENHTLYGYLLLHNTPSMSNIAPLVLTHHERWDGTGYPIGLKGTEIPLASRVICLLDSYDAMVNDRPYRKALSKAAAIQEIEDHLGSQFDPILGQTFIDFLRNQDKK